MSLSRLLRSCLLLGAFLPFAHVPAAAEPVNKSWRGVAVRGYDVVAYFTTGTPTEGSSDHVHEWLGATWRFASAAHRDLFAADPEAYAPQFGGFCAWAVSRGYTANIDPRAWRIVDGKLYLNYSPEVQRTWEQDIPGHIERARTNWPGLRDS